MLVVPIVREYAYIRKNGDPNQQMCIGRIENLYQSKEEYCSILNNRNKDITMHIKEIKTDTEWKYAVCPKDKDTILGFISDILLVGEDFDIYTPYSLFNDKGTKQMILLLTTDIEFAKKNVIMHISPEDLK